MAKIMRITSVMAILSRKKLFPKYYRYFLVRCMVPSILSIWLLMRSICSFCFSMFVRASSARSTVCLTRF